MKAAVIISIGCAILAIASWLGIWIPNRFGAGALWLFVGILIYIWGYNTDYYKRTRRRVK